MIIDCEILKLACFEASKAWVEGERQDIKNFGKPKSISEHEFMEFLKRWSVTRNTLETKRRQLWKVLRSETFDEAKCISVVANKIRDADLTPPTKTGERQTPTSLVSKVAFCKNPNAFYPMDTLSRLGLKMVTGTNIDRHAYNDYHSEFQKYFGEISAELGRLKWTNSMFCFGAKAQEVPASLFPKRVADKYLWIVGFIEQRKDHESALSNLRGRILFTRNTFSEHAYDLLRTPE